jgi:hypothetical protein
MQDKIRLFVGLLTSISPHPEIELDTADFVQQSDDVGEHRSYDSMTYRRGGFH